MREPVPAPEFKAEVPDSIRTPDKVSTRFLGELDYFDGMPGKATVDKAYDFIDIARGTEAFLSGMPAASVYAILEGFKKAGMRPGDMGITEGLMDARSLFLTPNSTTPYCMMELNLEDGPMVMDVPPGVLGPIGDAFFRWVTDVGLTGPDQGKGAGICSCIRPTKRKFRQVTSLLTYPHTVTRLSSVHSSRMATLPEQCVA